MTTTDDELALVEALSALRPEQGDAFARSVRESIRRNLLGVAGEPFRLGRFTVLGPLGGGGMGSVFVAYDPDLDRKIALKVLHSSGERGHREVLREGRALARLHHPAVVTVYEVGVVDDQVFVAMEYVSGADLRRWLAAPRTTDAILALLIEAGRGLAAAHDAGLVHLDFKPENVLVDAAGHARVIDFGLARTIEDLAPTLATATSGSGTSSRTGGTPGYIAPERLEGARGDARADQFSFCVTCWEALFGARPRAPESPATGRADVPAGVLAALRRGMSADPQARFASMHALLSALATRPARRRRAVLAALAVAALAGTYGVVQGSTSTPPACPSPWSKIEASWDEDRAEVARAAFVATDLPFSREAWATVKPALDRYAGAWLALHARACEDVAVHRIIPQAQFAQRMACLEDRRLHLAALVERFAEADAATVKDAVAAIERLPPIDICGTISPEQALFAGDQARIDERLEIRGALARARVDLDTGRPADAEPVIAAALERARASDRPALLAEALIVAGRAEQLGGRIEPGLAHAREALTTAVAHAEPLQAGWATLLMVQLLHGRRDGKADNDDLIDLAGAFARQAGEPPQLQFSILLTRATEATAAGRHQEACERLGRVRHYAQQHDLRRGAAAALANIGQCRSHLGDDAGAAAASREALAEIEPLIGALHPWIASVRLNLASALIGIGEYDAALQELGRVKAIAAANYPGDHVVIAYAHVNTAVVYGRQRRFAEALAEEQAVLAMNERLYGDRHPEVAHALLNLASTLGELGRLDEAHAALEQAASIHAEALDADHCDTLTREVIRGRLLVAAGRHAEALRVLEPLHERAAARECWPEFVGELALRLADALWATKGEPARARVQALLDAADRAPIVPDVREDLARLRATIR